MQCCVGTPGCPALPCAPCAHPSRPASCTNPAPPECLASVLYDHPPPCTSLKRCQPTSALVRAKRAEPQFTGTLVPPARAPALSAYCPHTERALNARRCQPACCETQTPRAKDIPHHPTCAARCFLASILPAPATTRCSGDRSCSSITALSYLHGGAEGKRSAHGDPAAHQQRTATCGPVRGDVQLGVGRAKTEELSVRPTRAGQALTRSCPAGGQCNAGSPSPCPIAPAPGGSQQATAM